MIINNGREINVVFKVGGVYKYSNKYCNNDYYILSKNNDNGKYYLIDLRDGIMLCYDYEKDEMQDKLNDKFKYVSNAKLTFAKLTF